MDADPGSPIGYQPLDTRRAEVRRVRRRRRKRALAVTLVLLAGGVFWVLYVCMGLGQRSQAVEHPGPVQVIGNDSAAWVFMQVERSVSSPGLIAGAPRRRAVQRLAVSFNEAGVLRQVSLPLDARHTFNENLSILFGLDDGIYMLGPTPDEVWRWDGADFVFDANTKNFSKLPELATTQPYQEEPVLDAASARNGWTHVRENHFFDGVSFSWNGGGYRLEAVTSSVPAVIRLRRVDGPRPWQADVATYDARPRPAQLGD